MFSEWDSFYLIIGSSAGALIGLMFVVATLTAGLDNRMVTRGAQVYFTPIVFHFAIVVVVSAIAAVPELSAPTTAVLLAICAVLGFANSVATTRRVLDPSWQDQQPHWSDKWFYGFLPALDYIVFGAAAGAVWIAPKAAPYAVGASMLALLLIGIRNAWDLATFLTQRPRDRP